MVKDFFGFNNLFIIIMIARSSLFDVRAKISKKKFFKGIFTNKLGQQSTIYRKGVIDADFQTKVVL